MTSDSLSTVKREIFGSRNLLFVNMKCNILIRPVHVVTRVYIYIYIYIHKTRKTKLAKLLLDGPLVKLLISSIATLNFTCSYELNSFIHSIES